MMIKQKQLAIKHTFNFAWTKFKEKALFFIGLAVLSCVLATLGENQDLSNYATNDDFRLRDFTLLSVLSIIVNTYLSLGIWKISINHIRGEKIQLSDLLTISFDQFIQYTIAIIISFIVVILGFILLIVPGIHIACRLMLVPGYIVDKNKSFDVALKSSFNATKGHTIKLFLWMLLACFIAIVGLIALIIGIFVAIPVISLALAYIYVQLSDDSIPEIVE